MYYQYFGLSEAPFSIAVNPRYLYMSPRHRDALAHLLYGIGEGGGFILLTGEVGTGKTTINRCLLEQMPDDTDVAIVLNPALSARELLATVCDELQIDYGGGSPGLKALTDRLHGYLLRNHERGRNTVLIIDEAQHLDFEVLEQIRLLTNLETDTRKLLQIILIGQPELAQLLARPELRQLNQRITARYDLEPLDQAETSAYIQHRLQVAGLPASVELFPAPVVRRIYSHTRGIPRLINVLCDRVLLGTYGHGKRKADLKLLRSAAAEVLGNETVSRVTRSRRRVGWSLAAVGLLAAVALLLAVYRPVTAVDRAPLAKPGPVAGVDEEPASQRPPAANAETQASPEVPVWLLGPAVGLEWLLRLSDPRESHVGGCMAMVLPGPVCGENRADTWSELAALDRPLLLDLVTPQRFGGAAILLGVNERHGWVLELVEDLGAAVRRIDLAQLGRYWTGDYRFIWQPPRGYGRSLAPGNTSPAVMQVARLFAQLDEQAVPLAKQRFNAALEQRVKLFQQEAGLVADGVVGVQTLLRLNEQLGVDVTASDLRRALPPAP